METIYILLTLIIRICLFYLYVYTIMFTLQYIKKPIKSASPFSSPSLPLFSLLLFLLSPLSNTSSITLALPSTSYTAFNNNSINPQFKEPSLSFSCSNQYRFTLNQTQTDMKSNSSYQIIIQGMEGLFFVNVKSLYGNIQPVQNVTQCSQSCAVQIWNNCKSQKEFDAIIVSVSGLTSIFYNVICDSDQVFSPFQYGLIILVIFSVLQVIICSKFQQADSYSNNGHYINNISLGIYCLFLIIGQTLILIQDQLTNIIVSYVCLTLSMIFGVLSIMVCFCQFFYWTKISCFRVGVSICKGKVKIRVMDGIGVCMGVGVVAAWYFTNKNWIISNVIYSMIFLAIIKLVKLGSLKMATITFIFTAVCNILFIILTQTVRKVYFNDIILYIFNNPFFIMCPCINFTPNEKCSWLFISCIAYPTILLCYLDRFDQSRSSKIYFTVYVICLITCSSLWIIISHFVPFTLPFDLLNSPICILFVGFFANRRGEFELLWNGQIFDAKHRNKSQQDHQLMDSLKQGRSDSYKSDWFKLKYSQMSSSSMQQAIQNVRRSLQMQSLPIQRKQNAEQKDSNPGGI